MKKVCIVGHRENWVSTWSSWRLTGDTTWWVFVREQSVPKLDRFTSRITIVPGATNDREVIRQAVAGCDGVLTVLVPWACSNTPRARPRQCSTSPSRGRG